MKNILYIAPVYDGTGYAHIANTTVLALDKAGHNVVVRKQKLTGQFIPPPDRVAELERRTVQEKVDVVIQHSLPPHFVRMGGVHNIGYFHWETDNIMPSNWHHNLALMDEIWVSWEDNARMLREMMDQNEMPRMPVRVVKGCILPSVSSPAAGEIELGFSTNPYTFYHIGDCSARKGTIDLITAYLREFRASDNVQMVLKSYVDGKSTQDSVNHIVDLVKNVKMSLRDRANGNWPKLHIVSQYLSDEGIQRLHEVGDCFISLEKGAAWNLPAFDAWAAGKSIISTNYGGQVAFLKHSPTEGIHLLETEKAFVYGMTQCGYPGVYTSYENWRQPSVMDAQHVMRQFYKTGKKAFQRDISAFTVDAVAKEMVEV